MKKLLFLLIACMALVSCEEFTRQAKEWLGSMQEDSASIITDSLNYTVTDAPYTFGVKADYPMAGDTLLLKAVREWINEQLGGSYEGDLADTAALMAHYSDRYFGEQEVDLKEYFLEDSIQCEQTYEFKFEYENDSLLTYVSTNYFYGGGAHGGYAIIGTTFDKKDGKQLGWDMFESTDSLNSVIKQGLVNYFKECGMELNNEEEMFDYLQVDGDVDLEHLPLPITEPWIEEDGVHFVYQQYEIAAYALGMPAFVIPVEEAKRYLKPNITKSF